MDCADVIHSSIGALIMDILSVLMCPQNCLFYYDKAFLCNRTREDSRSKTSLKLLTDFKKQSLKLKFITSSSYIVKKNYFFSSKF